MKYLIYRQDIVEENTRPQIAPIASKESLDKQTDHDADAEPDDHVKFTLGQQSEEEVQLERKKIMEYPTKVKKKRKKSSRKRSAKFSEHELRMRSLRGSELRKDPLLVPTDREEAMLLEKKDLDDMSHHRFDHMQGLERHKINKKSSANLMTIQKTLGTAKAKESHRIMLDSMYEDHGKSVDHSPHNVFVELDELVEDQWVEQSRWIKYEEAREIGSERWGKPHVSSLSFHSLLNLRLSLEKGTKDDYDSILLSNGTFS